MTDYFALLQQPRSPWLELDDLKRRYQELTLTEHPDQKGTNQAGAAFAAINEAYRSLKDPKLRLQHLLRLEGHDSSASQSIPLELIDLFSRIGDFIETTDRLLQRSNTAQNTLARSLIQPEILGARKRAKELLQIARQLYAEAETETRSLGNSWASSPEAIGRLYGRFSYLTRWIDQLEERQFQLSDL